MPISIAPVLRRIFDVRSGAILFVAKTSLLSLMLDVIVLSPIILVKYLITEDVEAHATASISIFDLLVFAPLFENICFIGVVEFLRTFDWRTRSIVLFVVALSAIAHLIAGGLRAFSGATGFAIMAYSYLLWGRSSFVKRYCMTVSQHVLMNTAPAYFLQMVG